MGKNKGGFSLLESYMMANAGAMESSANGNGSAQQPESIPLPDSMRASTLLEQIGKERSWTDEQIDHDLDILDNNRLYFVRDLRALSNQSWTVIGLLPLVRDLLRRAVDPEWELNEGSDASYKAYKDKKKMKKDKKKKKKNRKMMLGDPVAPMHIAAEGDTLAQDPETLRNTILNGSIDVGLADVGNRSMDDMNGGGASVSQKSVSFTDNATVGVAATTAKDKDKKKKKKMMMVDDSSSSSSSSCSSSSCSEDEPTTTTKTTTTSMATAAFAGSNGDGRAKVFSGRPITPVSNNRIQVRTSSGETFECDRFCPHKGVDLSTWGQVLGNKLICTKHNWKFDLEGATVGPKGRSVHPCRVNDW